MNPEELCMGCMRVKGNARVCGQCGWEEGAPPEYSGQLWPRTILAQKYLIGRVLGQGGFGITYLAWDLLLDRKLAIKEHFPREICNRARDERTVQPLTRRHQNDYDYGLKKFSEEGRALARFYDYPGIVLLLDFLEANATAYIVMAYVEGMTFKQYLELHGGKIAFQPALDIMMPVMDALREVHRLGMLHRDIAPDNVYLNEERQVKILDFGSTRSALREQSQLPAFKPGYAPMEQYSSGGKQGPWTDIYATAATLYRALTGQTPPESPDRLRQDELIPPSCMNNAIPSDSEKALLKALAVHGEDRFQSMEEFQNAIVPKDAGPSVGNAITQGKTGPRTPNLWRAAAAGLLLVASIAFLVLWLHARTGGRSSRSELTSLQAEIQDLQAKLSAQKGETESLRTKLNSVAGEKDLLSGQLETLKHEQDTLVGQRTSLTSQLDSARSEVKGLQVQTGTLQSEVSSLQEQNRALQAHSSVRKITIAKYELFNWDGNRETSKSKRIGPANNFQKNALRYLLCYLQGPNPVYGKQAFSAGLELRYIAPDGATRYTDIVAITSVREAQTWTTASDWGSERPGTFKTGSWKIEIWCEGQRLGTINFEVH
ncbi:MAG TPA: protein kinase [Candidatus Angelobacter sp.]|nr:protein kinase [Candidatus Angelobacter sp.]